MNQKPKVLFVDNDLGNFLFHRLEVARAAQSAEFEVHVAGPAAASSALLARHGIVFHPIPMSRSSLKPWTELATILALVRLYRALRPNLVHHLRLKPVLYGGIAAWWTGVPAVVNMLTGLGYVFTGNGARTTLLRRLVKWGFLLAFHNRNQRVIFQNPDDRSVFTTSRLISSQQTVLIKGSGVDVAVFRPTPEPEGPPLVVLASRMLWDKGIADFVAAAAELKAAGVAATFALVGDTDPGNPAAIPVSQLKEWALAGAVEWWGHRTDMLAVLAQSHIVCLPSLREGVPKVLIEAAACGRPIVTTDAPGCREIVRNGENGLLVPVRDSASLASALRLLIENADLRRLMGARGRRIAVEEFSLEQVIGETLHIYQELLAA